MQDDNTKTDDTNVTPVQDDTQQNQSQGGTATGGWQPSGNVGQEPAAPMGEATEETHEEGIEEPKEEGMGNEEPAQTDNNDAPAV